MHTKELHALLQHKHFPSELHKQIFELTANDNAIIQHQKKFPSGAHQIFFILSQDDNSYKMANYNILKNLVGTKLKEISLCASIRQQWCGRFGQLVSTFASQHNLPHPSQQISRF